MNKPTTTPSIDPCDQAVAKTILRAVGEELRRAREELQWSRLQLAARMPSGIGDRTITSYETGDRNLTVLRLFEQCGALQVSVPGLLTMALQRVRLRLEHVDLLVDLPALLDDDTAKFRPVHPWARNKLRRLDSRVATVAPSTVDELADFVGCDRQELADHLAKFIPDERPPADSAPTSRQGGS